MCCLGFYSLACGLTETQITDIPTPADDRFPRAKTPAWLDEATTFVPNGELPPDVLQLVTANDDEDLNDSTREPKIAEIFARRGVEVEFVN